MKMGRLEINMAAAWTTYHAGRVN